MKQRPIDQEEGNAKISSFMGEQEDYRNNWEPLMKVVDKIESMGYVVNVWSKSTSIFDTIFHPTFRAHHYHGSYNGFDRIEACWIACVYFVEYINEKK